MSDIAKSRDLLDAMITELRNPRHALSGYGRQLTEKAANALEDQAARIRELDAENAALREGKAQGVGVKPLGENERAEIIEAANIAMRRNQRGAQGQIVTEWNSIESWIIAETERRIRSALTPAPVSVDDGVAAIAAERQRQMDVEGWTAEHDDAHRNGEIAGAAACYALNGIMHWARQDAIARFCPWDAKWWKPKNRRADLVRAGALIAAEIDRLDRAALRALAGDKADD